MSLYNGPPRPGARGGRDQFNWENVKSDKDREFYLGHSVKASTGRWQKGKDIFWYAREKQDDKEQAIRDEVSMVKAREEELMLEALGMKPKVKKLKVQPQLDQREMKQLMEGAEDDRDQDSNAQNDADPVKGVGFRSGQMIGSGEAETETMAGTGVSGGQALRGSQALASVAQQLPPPPRLKAEELQKLQKAQKREKRKHEKEAKKEAKREAKREKKAKKKHRRKRSRSPSNSLDP